MTKARDSNNSRHEFSNSNFARVCDIDVESLIGALLSLDSSRRLAILDSCGADEPSGARFLIAAFDPFEIVEARGSRLRIWTKESDVQRVCEGSVLDLLDERLNKYFTLKDPSCTRLPATGACFAALSYELARTFESPHAFAHARDERSEADAVFSFFDALVIHDYKLGRTFVTSVNGSPASLDESCRALESLAASSLYRMRESRAQIAPLLLSSNFTREQYVAAVERVRAHIYAGDVYQANLTQQFVCRTDASPEEVYLHLRRDHPAAFAAFMRERERTIVSASPERFLRVEVLEADTDRLRRIEAWPIKGTKRRGETEEEDARLRAELLSSEKDAAENVMIVDLLRNDLGRVCEFGSVRVPELFAIQAFPTVWHGVSTVEGKLRSSCSQEFPCWQSV